MILNNFICRDGPNKSIGSSIKFLLKVGVEEAIVNAPLARL
jgi:hypothetical protein